jgi:cardiolipin synthase
MSAAPETGTAEERGSDRIATVPNALSFARLLCVPIFLWLMFGREAKLEAALLLGVLGATDWVDGWVARRFGQVSEFGKLLDPTADRILLAVAAVAMFVDGAVPAGVFWFVIVREVAIFGAVVWLMAAGAGRIEVLWVGKAGAFALMFAFPLFLLGEAVEGSATLFRVLAWGWAVPGLLLSYYAAYQYALRVPGALRGVVTEDAGGTEEAEGAGDTGDTSGTGEYRTSDAVAGGS